MLLFNRPEWFDQARCRGADPALFFPEQGEHARQALLICLECPVTEECLAYALSNGEREGVWGGRVPKGRLSLSVAPTRLLVCGLCETRFVEARNAGIRHRYCSDACRYEARRQQKRAAS